MSLRLIFILSVILIPSHAFAWGPLTHVYLGSEIFYLGSLLPAGVYALIRKYRQDFLYGNIMADMIIGKKYLPKQKNPHCWDVAFKMLDSTSTRAEQAFVYGYLSHLAADTVAHGKLTQKRRHIGHTLLEVGADSRIDRAYWFQAMAIEKKVQARNDLFLERSLSKLIFSFKTNRRIFKSWVILSGLNRPKVAGFIALGMPSAPQRQAIEKLHEKSLDRIIDVLSNGKDSAVLNKDPLESVRRGRVLMELFK